MICRKEMIIIVAFVIVLLGTGPVYADKVSELETKVSMMEEQINVLKSEIAAFKKKEVVPETEITKEEPVIAKPALLEKEGIKFDLGGQYRIMANYSNFPWHAESISDNEAKSSFFNQRFRPWLNVIVNENVSGYLELEIGNIIWGDNYEWTKIYMGPATTPGGDRVGIELRRGYLTYQNEWLGKVVAGIQEWSDSFGDTLASGDWDFNVGGVSYKRSITNLWNSALKLGVFSLCEGDVSKANDDTILFTSDIDFPVFEESSIGLSAYFLNDGDQYSYPLVESYDSSRDLWAGLRGETKLGPVLADGFFIYNYGEMDSPDFKHQGYATRLQGSCEIGPATARVQGIYSTGEDDPSDTDSNEFRTIAQSERDNYGSQGYWSYLALTSPRGSSDIQDLGVGLQNRGLGLTTIQGSLAFPIIKRVSGYTAIGWLRSSADNPNNGKCDMGTELVAETTIDLTGNLKWDLGLAYLFTGDFYKASSASVDPENLYEFYSRLQLEF